MPSLPDVLAAQRALLAFLPCELVNLVLTFAEYWASSATRRDISLTIQASNEPLFNAKWLYMLSDPIPPARVKSVHFSIKSSDQGWGGFPEYKNRYRNSYTWFEASIIRPSASSHQQPPWLFDALHNPISLYATSNSTTELYSPYKNRTKRWLVQMNVQASRHIRRHDITWHNNSPPHTLEYDDKSGSGRGLDFVDSLKPGDRIALVARALYPGWENHVQSAEIEITYQI